MSASTALSSYYKKLNNSSLLAQKFVIPAEFGQGEVATQRLKNGISITKWQMTYLHDTLVYGKPNPHFLNLNLCLTEAVSWEDARGKEYLLGQGETYIHPSLAGNETIFYQKQRNYSFVNIKLPMPFFSAVVQEYFDLNQIKNLEKRIQRQHKAKIERPLLKIIQEIYDCSLEEGYQDLYAAGKIQELLALYMKAFLEEEDKLSAISRSDLKALEEVKQIVENNLVETPALGELARLVNLNTSKLCKLFKAVNGVTLHTYIINQRMQHAFELLALEGASVTSVAHQLGYTNISHFSASFKKQHSMLPSEFLKLK